MSTTVQFFNHLRSARAVLRILLVCALATIANAQVIEIGNKELKLQFDSRSGALTGIEDARIGVICKPKGDSSDLWNLFLEGSDKPFTPSLAKSLKADRNSNGASLSLTWSEFGPAMPDLKVVATVKLPEGSDQALWHLDVLGLQGKPLRSVVFPKLRDLTGHSNEVLAVPMWMGQALQNPRERLSGPNRKLSQYQWDYPGHLSLQCLAVYGEHAGGLYLACNDTAAFRKNFFVKGDTTGGLHAEIEHLPERSGNAQSWSMPYQVIAGGLRGDWMSAAETYRSWATNQVWAKQSRLAQGLVQNWVKDTGLWIWNRGTSDDVLTPALELQKKLDLPVSVFWHWWHGCSYDAGFPDYFPPREGTDRFTQKMKEAQLHQVRALVYMNQRLWGMNTPSWGDKGAAAYAVKDPQGKIRPEYYNTFTGAPCAAMCMGTEFWRDAYAGLAVRAVRELGVDGIYMDQACTSLACYDKTHAHPAGGGKYWIQGFQKMQQNIRERSDSGLAGKAPALAGEGCGEPWLPYLDIMLSLQVSKERYAGPDGWDPIPFFHAVYHAYAVLYGNYSSLTMPPYDELWPKQTAPKEPLQLLDRKFSEQFYLEQARAFVWGQQPTIANFLPKLFSERREEIEYVVKLARIRSTTRDYLQYGTLLRSPILGVPNKDLEMSRLSIYAGQQEGLKEFKMASSLALAAAWRSPQGKTAVALASIAPCEMSVSMELRQDYRIPTGTKIWKIDDSGRKQAGIVSEKALTIPLPPRGACVLEFSE